MAEFNMLPLYTDSFIGDTINLDAAETGAYLMLLMSAWRLPGCRLPDDEVRLARFARCDGRTWRRVRDAVMAFWEKDDEGFWMQGKLSKVRESCNTSRENKKRAAEAARAAKALKTLNSPAAEQGAELPDVNLHTVSVSVSKEEREPIPSSPTTSQGTAWQNDLDEIGAWLDTLVGEDQPCKANLDISPIVGLIRAGYQRSEIALGIRAAQSKGLKAKTWAAFVNWITGVRERADRAQAAGAAAPPPTNVVQHPHNADDTEWTRRVQLWLSLGKTNWPSKWGPSPRLGSTLVPAHILARMGIGQEAA